MLLVINNSKASPDEKTPVISIEIALAEYKIPFTTVNAQNREELHRILSQPNAIKGCILSGTTIATPYEVLATVYSSNVATLTALNVPVLGICWGSHILCESYGGIMGSLKTRHEGYTDTQLKDIPLFEDVPKTPKCFYSHNNYPQKLNQCVPIAMARLGGKDIIMGFKHNKKHIYGLVFHPEFTHPVIYRNFYALCT
jgi:GMP synthase-like glutamine amidotransferase